MQAPSVKMKFNGILNRHGRHATHHGFNLSATAINIKSLLRHTRISLARILHPRIYGGVRTDAAPHLRLVLMARSSRYKIIDLCVGSLAKLDLPRRRRTRSEKTRERETRVASGCTTRSIRVTNNRSHIPPITKHLRLITPCSFIVFWLAL